MKKASDFLYRFKKNLTENDKNKKKLKEVIKDIIGISLLTEKIIIKNKNFYIESESVIKNEILFNKEKIMEMFHKKKGSKDIKKIK